MANLSSLLERAAAAQPDHIALRMDDLTLTYARLREAAGRMSALLAAHGVRPGDRVGIMLPNVPAFPISFYGALAAGAVVVPMNPLLKSREIAYYLGDSGARVVLAWHAAAGEAAKGAADAGAEAIAVETPDLAGSLAEFVPATGDPGRHDQDDAVILYTSGTTGRPKGAELTHAGLVRNAEITARTLLKNHAGDVTMGCLPLFHVFGLTCGLNAAVAAAGTLTLLPRFDPARALEIIQRDKVTIFEGVPTMYAAMLHLPQADPAMAATLRVCVSGGASLPVEILRGFEEKFGCMILEGYGLSETSPVASFNHPDKVRKPGSIGTPIEGVEMRLVDDLGQTVPGGEIGEIAIRGHNVMKGYWNKPEATAEAIADGWFRTGDMARVDSDGYYYIVDRKKDLIIRGGYNVYPREIEEVLHEHPAVTEVAVIGIPHPDLGEEVGAAVALKPGASATPEELRAFARDRVAAYKYPRRVWLVDSLPKGPTGKILRREVQGARSARGGWVTAEAAGPGAGGGRFPRRRPEVREGHDANRRDRRRLLPDRAVARRRGPPAAAPGQGVPGEVGSARHQPLLDQGGVPVRPDGRLPRARHPRPPFRGLRLPGRRLPAGRHDRDGAGPGRPVRSARSSACTAAWPMGSIFLCGSEEQKQRWLPEMARMEQDRRVRPDRTRRGVRRGRRADHHGPAGDGDRSGCWTGRRSGSATPPSPTT